MLSAKKASDPVRIAGSALGTKDSNLYRQSQSLLCYRYTSPQYVVDTVGVKPTTPCVQSRCSLTELRAQYRYIFLVKLF